MENNVKENIRLIISTVVTLLCVIGLGILIFVIVGFGHDDTFWFRFITGTTITVVMAFLWLPSGKEKGEKNEVFLQNKKAYNDKANSISENQQHKQLKLFCHYKNQEKKIEKIQYLLDKVGIDFREYKKIVENKLKKEDIIALEEYSKKQKRMLIKLTTRKIKTITFKPTQITTGIEGYKSESLHNTENFKQILHFVLKILINLVVMFFLASVMFDTKKGITIADFAQFFMWVVAIITASGSSYLYGIKTVTVFRNNYYVKLDNFLAEFQEWLKNPILAEQDKESAKLPKFDTKAVETNNLSTMSITSEIKGKE